MAPQGCETPKKADYEKVGGGDVLGASKQFLEIVHVDAVGKSLCKKTEKDRQL